MILGNKNSPQKFKSMTYPFLNACYQVQFQKNLKNRFKDNLILEPEMYNLLHFGQNKNFYKKFTSSLLCLYCKLTSCKNKKVMKKTWESSGRDGHADGQTVLNYGTISLSWGSKYFIIKSQCISCQWPWNRIWLIELEDLISSSNFILTSKTSFPPIWLVTIWMRSGMQMYNVYSTMTKK